MEKMKRKRAPGPAARRPEQREGGSSLDGELIHPKPRVSFQIIDETGGAFRRRAKEPEEAAPPKEQAPRSRREDAPRAEAPRPPRAGSGRPARQQPARFRQDREEEPSVPAKSPRPHRRRVVPVVLSALAVVCLGGGVYLGIQALAGGETAPADPATLTSQSYRLPTALSVEPVEMRAAQQQAQGVASVTLTDPLAAGFFETKSTTDGQAPAGVTAPSNVDNSADTLTKLDQWNDYNSDIKAWLTVPGTNIDYPVCWASDVNYYLHLGYDKQYSYYGVVWSAPGTTFGTASQLSPNTVLYGHNWTNYSANPRIAAEEDIMFAQLTSFHHLSFAQEHPVIYYTTPEGGTMTFKIFAAFYTEVAFDYINSDGGQYILDGALARSIHDYNVDVTTSDKIITLSTCTRAYGQTSNQRFVVMGRLLRKGESASNNNITDNPGHQKPNVWG